MKYIIVTGGVLSGLGKGITTASIGSLLKNRGYSITAMKIDPYLNCDAGTMNPIQHGEVFVLEDGGEVDLDLGNYERFLNVSLGRDNNLTTGRAYKAVIENERRGEYLGKTVQIIPHVTDYIKSSIKSVGEKANADVMLVEIGGTVGDIESMPFIEATRQLRNEVGNENLVFVHVTLVPVVGAVGEQKTKPTQHSVSELRSIGIQPDIIVARSKSMLGVEARQKISLFCDVPSEAVISVPDADTIYRVPLIIDEQHLTTYLLKRLGLKSKNEDLKEWRAFVERIANPRKSVTIAVVGKYIDLKDSYLSISEAFTHAGAELGAKVNVVWIEAEDCVETGIDKRLSNVDGVLVPGGFGLRGTEGKICAIKYAREHGIPFLGICYGFQLAIIEFCRNVIGWKDADTTENNAKTSHPVIDLLPEQKSVKDLGGTMRLGAYPVKIKKNTGAYELYKKDKISERHRHRYEVNPVFIDKIEDAGLLFSGRSLDGTRMEIAELSSNSYFIASQFHPEFKSRPNDPAKLFLGLLRAALERKK